MKLVFCTCPPAEAESLVRQLLEERLIGCANIIPGVRSLYRWKGAIEEETEAVLFMETPSGRADAALARLAELHSYDVPKIVVLDPERCSAEYLGWLRGVTTPDR